MSTQLYLGIKTQNPVVGLTSTNPGTANAMIQSTQTSQQNQGQGVPVIEVPWHKATPDMKNIK
jgi:low affinity Fe/Cu permease